MAHIDVPESSNHPTTAREKALAVNLDSQRYGTFAEIGAGQEVVRWFFQAGAAAGTIAKSMSAYDMTVSDAIYGPAKRYVCRERLEAMLDHEHELNRTRLQERIAAGTTLFAFADTVSARSYQGGNECHGWMGIRFQARANQSDSQIVIHVRMLDDDNRQQQDALGIVGVNLVYGASYLHDEPEKLLKSLIDGLTTSRIEIDVVDFSRHAFEQVDNRVMALRLVQLGLCGATMFAAGGKVLQPSEVLYKKPVLVERGRFRPATLVNVDIIQCASRMFMREPDVDGNETVVIHAAHAEEGVLYVRALVSLEISRGEVNRIEFDLPSDVQVNRVHSESGGISDWRIAAEIVDGRRTVSVYLDHPLCEAMRLDVDFDRSLASNDELEMPFLRVSGVQRQRGMMALLATKEIALKPAKELDITQVGENQLPAFFRELLERTVAHTFKYVEVLPTLVVVPATPDPVVAKFDAEINTLISLMDVTMRGAASANIRVKSGRLERIQLEIPGDVNLLSLSAPSLRTHKVVNEAGRQLINVEFTQEMDGQFWIEANYERIAADADVELPVPTLSVVGAEVEQGRIAVEALASVEVQVARSDQLSSVDPSELPQQLVLKTTNPILLAYKYVHTDPPYELALQITRHPEVSVQSASIDQAHYQTLFTQDGLAVTTARFTVRNNRKQFLRVQLPEGAQVWSATVAGRPEKPAISVAPSDERDETERPEILIKVINSIDGFPVELVYATPLPKMGGLGRVRAHLPQPDMIVTATRWDVFLPESFRYGNPDTNMNLAALAEIGTPELLRKKLEGFDDNLLAQQPNHPLRIEVPASGVHFSFEKLYANQSDQAAAFSIPYSSAAGARLGQILALLGGALFWGGIGLGFAKLPAKIARAGFATAAAGLATAIGSIGYFATNPTPVLVLSALALTALLARVAATQWRRSSVKPGA